MIDSTEQQFLRAVFCLSRAAKPVSVATIACMAKLTATQSVLALMMLGHAGLMDTERMRLTMRGLAAAVRLDAAVHQERRQRIRAQAQLRRALRRSSRGEARRALMG